MANSMGSLYIGSSGVRNAQNAINTTANNLTNVDTTGYVRQQVVFTDRDYTTFGTASVSSQQSGLGVTIGDVVHARDIFLDKSYRSEYGREAFYAAYFDAVDEIETYFQEMEGEAFQTGMNNFWTAIQTLANDPSDSVNQNLVIQKASLFLSRGQAVYSGLQKYQDNINTQVSDDIDKINELGQTVFELNQQIQRVEAGGLETAMTLRDARDEALDELSGYVNIEYKEDAFGVVSIKIEGTQFVDEAHCYEMGKQVDKSTGYITPYWPQLSDTTTGTYEPVFDFSVDISSELNTDKGELKALVLARGDKSTNYLDLLKDENGNTLDAETYLDTIGMSCMETVEAELDQLLHKIVTDINDALCPNTTAGEAGIDLTQNFLDEDGNTVLISADTKILDADNCYVGSDRELPPRELFVRTGCERYTTVTGDDGQTYYIYNEEDETDTSKMYTIMSLSINSELKDQPSLLAGFTQNGEVGYALGDVLTGLWENQGLTLNPTDGESCTYTDYYKKMISDLATLGDVYQSTALSLDNTVLSVENQRQQVIGVSSDEELQNLIKYQNAYNAASRFMNVISEMIEHIVTNL